MVAGRRQPLLQCLLCARGHARAVAVQEQVAKGVERKLAGRRAALQAGGDVGGKPASGFSPGGEARLAPPAAALGPADAPALACAVEVACWLRWHFDPPRFGPLAMAGRLANPTISLLQAWSLGSRPGGRGLGRLATPGRLCPPSASLSRRAMRPRQRRGSEAPRPAA